MSKLNISVLIEDGSISIYDYNGQFNDDIHCWTDDIVEYIEGNKALMHLVRLTKKHSNFYVFLLHFSDCNFVCSYDDCDCVPDSYIEIGTLDIIEMNPYHI